MAAAHQSVKSSTTWGLEELAKTAHGKAILERHLVEVTKGAAFKGSQRSAQFLEYIFEQSLLGRPELLKERLIGMKLFGRVPTYDTGEDAIVRVTATDVRRRLSQHYSRVGNSCEFRISLPPGTYVPELVQTSGAEIAASQPPSAVSLSATPEPLAAAAHPMSVAPLASAIAPATPASWKWFLAGTCMMTIGLVSLGFTWWFAGHARSSSSPSPRMLAPWSSIFDGSRQVLIVASDPNIEETQRIAHATVQLSDYANQHYLPPNVDQLPPMQVDFMKNILRGNKISSVDGSLIADLIGLMPPGHLNPVIKGARDTRSQDLETNGNLIFLGSPRSNPWTAMYDQLLDFRFEFDERNEREIIRDIRPAPGERTEYVPTAGGFDTGNSYATISVFQMPGHDGRVLLIAGANGEGTAAAGALVTDPSRWESALQACHLKSIAQPIQLLLQLGTMAGSANLVSVVSCHQLMAPASHP